MSDILIMKRYIQKFQQIRLLGFSQFHIQVGWYVSFAKPLRNTCERVAFLQKFSPEVCKHNKNKVSHK